MVALPPITATSNLPGYARPVAVAQPAPAADAARSAASAAATAAAVGGGAASSAIANKARQVLVDASKSTAAGEPATDSSNQPRAQLPTPPFAQSVGLYSGSTRVYVDIVQSGDDGRKIARVFGTPPAQSTRQGSATSSAPVNFVA
ncbi:MAG: hypothetical protein HY059_11725 [Proteobacteria bacterium]|nr:hypothetical protein [Pseudomonadota bacterium]